MTYRTIKFEYTEKVGDLSTSLVITIPEDIGTRDFKAIIKLIKDKGDNKQND